VYGVCGAICMFPALLVEKKMKNSFGEPVDIGKIFLFYKTWHIFTVDLISKTSHGNFPYILIAFTQGNMF